MPTSTLGFEIEDNQLLSKIEYVPKRLPCPIDFSKPLGGVNEAVLAQSLNSKHSGWKYEKERRLRVRLEEKRDGTFYYPFNNSMQLREVIIGARSSLSIVDVAEAIGNQPDADVKIWTARPAHSYFNMCTNNKLPVHTISGVNTRKQRLLADALRKYKA